MSERFRDLVGASLGDDPALSGGGSLERWLAPTSESRVEQVPIEAIDDPHWRPDTADTDPNYRALKSSVRASGILQPLLLRPIGGDRYQLVSGARRLRAARETGQSAVPVIIRELSDVEALLGAWDAVMRAGVSEAERQTLYVRLGGSGMADAEVRALLSGVPVRDDGAAAAAPPLATMRPPLPAAPAPPAVAAAPATPAHGRPASPAAAPVPVVPPAAATPPAPAIPAPVGPRPKVISISLPPEALAAATGAAAPQAPAPSAPAASPAPAPPAAAAPPAVSPWTPVPPAPAPPAPPVPAPAAYTPSPADSAAPPAPPWSVRRAARPGDPAAPVAPPAPSSEPPAWVPPASPPVSFLPSGAEAAPASSPAPDPVPGAAGAVRGGVVGRLARDPRTYATVGVFFAVWAVVFIIVAVLIGASNQRLLVAAVVVAAVGFVTAIVGLALGPRRAT
jgi:hypothetical protein